MACIPYSVQLVLMLLSFVCRVGKAEDRNLLSRVLLHKGTKNDLIYRSLYESFN